MRVRHVVINEEAVKTNVTIRAHRLIHIHVAWIHKLLVELRHRARDVTKMHVQDLSPRAEVTNLLIDIDTIVHLREGALTKLDRIRIARIDLDEPLVRGEAAQ